jgi:thioredoxin-related protein
MKVLTMSGFFMLLAITVMAASNQLAIGEKAKYTDVKMPGVTDAYLSLDDLKQENGLVVIFSCNTCPFVRAWEDRYNGIWELAAQNKVGMVLLNSNYTKRAGDDSLEAMKEHAAGKDYKMPYLMDQESLIANAWGGQTTPHVFFFDKDFRLVYKGAIDDNYKSAADVTKAYLKDAIVSLAAGKPIPVSETKPLGCSIKRKVQD